VLFKKGPCCSSCPCLLTRVATSTMCLRAWQRPLDSQGLQPKRRTEECVNRQRSGWLLAYGLVPKLMQLSLRGAGVLLLGARAASLVRAIANERPGPLAPTFLAFSHDLARPERAVCTSQRRRRPGKQAGTADQGRQRPIRHWLTTCLIRLPPDSPSPQSASTRSGKVQGLAEKGCRLRLKRHDTVHDCPPPPFLNLHPLPHHTTS
jgi:hypothetical protein